MTDLVTAPQKVLLRAGEHSSRKYLAFLNTTAVFSARLTGSYSTHDQIAQITFGSVSLGTYSDIPVNALLAIGSTNGGHEYGFARIRAAATSSIIYIGEGSEIDWPTADGDPAYLSVYPDFSPWARHVKMVGTDATVRMDYSIDYSDQNTNLSPIANLGADAVVWLTGATVSVSFDASGSFCLGSSISTYAWTCSAASATSGTTTATPTFTFNSAQPNGALVKCVVTASNGKSTTAYRYIWVFNTANPPFENFEFVSCSGDVSQGGWSFTVRAWEDADQTLIRDRSKVILFARDWYGATEGSIAILSGRENIIAAGWVAEETITNDPVDGGPVEFTVYGPQYWLAKMNGFPAGVQDTTATATKWTEFDDLTVDKGLYHFLYWRTTLWTCADWYKTSDTRRATLIEAGNQNIWGQITEMVGPTILARPVCDRYGRLYTQIPVNLTPPADRSTIPQILTVQEPDYQRPTSFERVTVRDTALVSLSGVYATTADAKAFYSLSPGHVFARYGSIETVDRLLLSTQGQANQLAGMISASRNNEYPSIPIKFNGNYRMFDIAPIQRGYIAIDTADNVRGVAYDGYIIPKAINYEFADGYITTTIEFEGQTAVDLATNGDPPGETPFPPIPPFPPIDPPPLPPPLPPTDANYPAYIIVRDFSAGIWCWSQFTSAWTELSANLTDGDLVELGQFGRIEIQVFGVGSNLYGIGRQQFYYGDITNGMRIVKDATWFETDVPGISLSDVAVNPFSGLAYVAGVGQSQLRAYTGNANDLGNRFDFSENAGGNISISSGADGKIVLEFSDSGVLCSVRSSTDSGVSYGSKVAMPSGYAFGAWMSRGGGYSDCIVFSHMFGGTDFAVSLDGGATSTGYTAPTGNGGVRQQYGINEDGSIIMCAAGSKIKISTDGGATFSDSVTTFGAIIIVQNFGGSNWIAVGNTEIMISNDDGLSWPVNLFGSLNTQIAARFPGDSLEPKEIAFVIRPFGT